MTYALSSDIVEELKGVSFTSTSQVTDAAVLDFLDQADAEINMYIGKRYTTPPTSSDALLVLKKCEVDIVVYRVTKILDLTKSVPIPDKAIPQEITEGTAYRNSISTLKAIRDGKMDLPGETEINATSSLLSFHTETGNSDICPMWEKGVKQW